MLKIIGLIQQAEIAFEKYLISLNNGVLKNQYIKQHWFSRKWILDFFSLNLA